MGREELQLRARWLSQWSGMVTCIEPTTGSTFGAPDVHVANAAVDGFIEFKVLDEGGTFMMRQNQRIWHAKYQKLRANSGFCILCQQGFWMMQSRQALQEGRVHGEPVNWLDARPPILTFALRQIFHGSFFNRSSIEHLIEPLAMEGMHRGQEKLEACRTGR
jgi:hypothetical protein